MYITDIQFHAYLLGNLEVPLNDTDRFDEVIKETGKIFKGRDGTRSQTKQSRWHEQGYIGKKCSRCFQGNVNNTV